MFTQAFLCYINRHAAIAGEGGKECEETDRRKKRGTRTSIHASAPAVPPHSQLQCLDSVQNGVIRNTYHNAPL